MAAFEIPLVARQNQKMNITLNGVQYSLRFNWVNSDQGGWALDIYSNKNAPVICGIPLVTGSNLLAQYDYLGIGGSLYVQTDGNVDAVPTFDDLGQQSHLYYVTTT